jgi:hypothetical protein
MAGLPARVDNSAASSWIDRYTDRFPFPPGVADAGDAEVGASGRFATQAAAELMVQVMGSGLGE